MFAPGVCGELGNPSIYHRRERNGEVCVCVCLSVCLSVCLKAMRFDILARIATKLYTRCKDFPGKVLKPMSIS